MGKLTTLMVVSAATALFCVSVALAVNIDPVTIGDPGNAPDNTTYGSVSATYNIGKYEVTNAQYAEFLNAVAASDPKALYNTGMASGYGGITRSGSSPNYTYDVIPGRGNMPVNYVSWYDTLRFANWMHNGQPTGMQDASTTEDGAYDMSLGSSVVRKPGALVFLPTEDEWYKAAYYKGGGTNAGYWDYPTASDTEPTAEAPPGTTTNGSVNYNFAANSDLTDVGAYTYKPSDSAYGTFDQGGNVAEWNEGISVSSVCILWGGSFVDLGWSLHAANRNSSFVTSESHKLGFRVAEVPEPSTVELPLDILPGDDPNPFVPNEKGQGKIPMAIFATEEVAAADIKPESIKIAGVLGPVKTSINKDVDGDGLIDLVMHFSRRSLIDTLSLDAYEVGAVVEITVEASRVEDGCPIEATDSIVIVGRKD